MLVELFSYALYISSWCCSLLFSFVFILNQTSKPACFVYMIIYGLFNRWDSAHFLALEFRYRWHVIPRARWLLCTPWRARRELWALKRICRTAREHCIENTSCRVCSQCLCNGSSNKYCISTRVVCSGFATPYLTGWWYHPRILTRT